MKELSLQNMIRAELSKHGIMNFRNNTGMGWAGKPEKIYKQQSVVCYPGDVVVRQARPLHAGLCEGSSDIIGIKSVIVTPDMIDKTVGIFVGAEVKTKAGRISDKQHTFRDNINKAGGLADVIRSVDEVVGKFL